MTRAERMKAFEMRLDGKSWKEIAAQLGYTPNGVRMDMISAIRYTPRQVNCIYPALRAYIVAECGGSVEGFSRHCNIPESTMGNILVGRHQPNMDSTRLILKATGLTFDEAFRREEDT